MPFANFAGHSFSTVSVEKNAPSQGGVFGLCNPRGWLFISASRNIRADLLDQLPSMAGQATGFTYELCVPGMEIAREERLIRELKPSRVRTHAI